MKTVYPPCYHHSVFVATHALGHMMYGLSCPKCMSCMTFHKATVVITITGRADYFDD